MLELSRNESLHYTNTIRDGTSGTNKTKCVHNLPINCNQDGLLNESIKALFCGANMDISASILVAIGI